MYFPIIFLLINGKETALINATIACKEPTKPERWESINIYGINQLIPVAIEKLITFYKKMSEIGFFIKYKGKTGSECLFST